MRVCLDVCDEVMVELVEADFDVFVHVVNVSLAVRLPLVRWVLHNVCDVSCAVNMECLVVDCIGVVGVVN